MPVPSGSPSPAPYQLQTGEGVIRLLVSAELDRRREAIPVLSFEVVEAHGAVHEWLRLVLKRAGGNELLLFAQEGEDLPKFLNQGAEVIIRKKSENTYRAALVRVLSTGSPPGRAR